MNENVEAPPASIDDKRERPTATGFRQSDNQEQVRCFLFGKPKRGRAFEIRSCGPVVTYAILDYPEFKTENGVAQTPEGPGAWFSDPDGDIIAVTQMKSPS